MAILTLYLVLVLERSGVSAIVQATVILSLIPVLVFVDLTFRSGKCCPGLCLPGFPRF